MDQIPGLDGFVLTATLLKVVWSMLAVVALILLLRWIDKRNGISFGTDILAGIRADPMAAAVYFGARFVGAALLVGLVVA